MFSDQPNNRKRNQKKRAGAEPDFHVRASLDSLREQEYRLNAQIGELEEILTFHAKKEERHPRSKRENILPPLEDDPHDLIRERQTVRSRRRSQKKRTGSLYFFMLLVIAIALGYWLFCTGG